MKLWKLAFRNLLGNGLKTWLTVFILSLSFVMIIFMQGILAGWDRQAIRDMKQWEIGGGQYWSERYDPYDPFTLDSAAVPFPETFGEAYEAGTVEPILIATGTIFPSGRSMPVMIKGIRPEQQLLRLPTALLKSDDGTIPAIIGYGMARQAGLNKGDYLTLRWRDAHGTFEAAEIYIADLFSTFVPAVDNGQLWLPLETLQQMILKPDAATIIIRSEAHPVTAAEGWVFKSTEELTRTLRETLRAKRVGQSIFYIIFLLLGLLAVFDTQMLAIFRRRREIGTFVALGMTQKEVIRLFTLEGTLNAVLAVILGAIYGIPVFFYFSKQGIPMPADVSDFGVAISDKIYPAYPLTLVMGSLLLIISITALVSYLPARKIARMNPTDAIKGKTT